MRADYRRELMQTLTLRQRFRLARFTRGFGPEEGPVELDRSRVFILPTGIGLAFAAMLLVMLFGSINYNNSLGHMFTFLLGSMAVVSIFYTYRNLVMLGFAVGRVRPVYAGERAGFEILVSNPSLYARIGIRLESAGQPPASIELEPLQTIPVTLYRDAKRRGTLTLGRCRVATCYPLGLFRAWSHLDLRMHCLVYPHPGPRRPLPQGSAYKPNQSGDKGRGVDDFAGFRPYRPGDSPRHLFWKAAAREQTLLTKQFGGDRTDELWLDWRDLDPLDTETRLSQLCRWVLDADRNRQCYGLRLPGVEFAVASGDVHKQRCLEALARFE
jgi:uncharacterized protein (DUF58 family)